MSSQIQDLLWRVRENVPTELQELPVWLLHDASKCPLYTSGEYRSGALDSAADRGELVRLEQAAAVLESGTVPAAVGLGVALGPVPGTDVTISGIDFDHVFDEEGQLSIRAQSAISACPDAYAEQSIGGDGVHVLGWGDVGTRGPPKHGEAGGSVEIYSRKRYFTVSGNVLQPGGMTDLAPVAEEARRLWPFPPPPETAEPIGLAADDEDTETVAKGGRNSYLTSVAGRYRHFGLTEDEMRSALVSLNASRCKPPLPRADIDTIARSVARYEPAVSAASQGDGDTRPRFEFSSIEELAAKPPPAWLIPGVLPEADIGMIYGPSGCGKSFLAFDMACALARGTAWNGIPVRQTRVAWVAAEAGGSIGIRAKAYCCSQGITAAELTVPVLCDAPNLADRADIDELIAELRSVEAELVVIDTLAAASAGADENGAGDMSRVMDSCRRIRAESGCMVLLIHHSGKDQARGARGWSGIRAAMDAEIAVRRDEVDPSYRRATLTKLRDAPDGQEYWFRLSPVADSCVVEFCSAPERSSKVEGNGAALLGPVAALVIERHAALTASAKGLVSADQLTEDVAGHLGGRNARKRARQAADRLAAQGRLSVLGLQACQ